MGLNQLTIKSKVSCTGIGLHTGEKIRLTLRPAKANTGIIFIRKDIPSQPVIPVTPQNIVDTDRSTNLALNGYRVQTIEHLMAAFYGLGIDNAIVELEGPEVPAMDGSALPFVILIQEEAGIKEQKALKRFLKVEKPLEITEEEKSIKIYPSKELRIDYRIYFDHPLIKSQRFSLSFSSHAFVKEISRARTFGFYHEVEYLKKKGLIKGGSLDNAIVLDKFKVLNKDGLRFTDEFVRHKVLDFLGDLATIGMPVIAHFVVEKSGHALNHRMLSRLEAMRSHWRLISIEDIEDAKVPVSGLQRPVPVT